MSASRGTFRRASPLTTRVAALVTREAVGLSRPSRVVDAGARGTRCDSRWRSSASRGPRSWPSSRRRESSRRWRLSREVRRRSFLSDGAKLLPCQSLFQDPRKLLRLQIELCPNLFGAQPVLAAIQKRNDNLEHLRDVLRGAARQPSGRRGPAHSSRCGCGLGSSDTAIGGTATPAAPAADEFFERGASDRLENGVDERCGEFGDT